MAGMNRMVHLSAAEDALPRADRKRWWRHPFAFAVVLPTLLAALYLFAIASPQYASEAQFVVRGLEAQGPRVGGMGQLFGLGGALAPGQQEAQSVREYLRSHDAVAALRGKGVDLAALYARPGTDWLSRLRPDKPRAETLLDYYRGHVDVTFDPDDNITHLSVRAFAPEDARRIAAALLQLGEERVNAFNARLFDASLRAAAGDAQAAEQELGIVEHQLSAFRQGNADIDPAASGAAGQKALADAEVDLGRQRALLADMRRQLSPASPQVRAVAGRVSALQAEVAAARGRIAGQPGAVAARLGNYEELRLRQDFAAKRYEAARARLEEARARAVKERLFVVPVVEPNLPERPDRPTPWRTTLLVFVGLVIAYGIGWMLLAGLREHQA
jgi:capsular polysaccharide transport system permease protein